MDSVSRWLDGLGLGRYISTFAESDVDEEAVTDLAEADLEKLGVTLGHRKKLIRAIEALHSENSPRSPPGITGRRGFSPASAAPAEAERRQLTVMFCDLVGSTALSQRLDAEDLRDINRAYQDACTQAIEEYEGFVARYMGDGVLAYFGYPLAHEDDAERGVRAGLAVVASVDALNEGIGRQLGADMAVRVGLATGPVVVGDLIGEGASRESPVVGETPNLAARLQGLAESNAVVVAPETHRLTAGHFQYVGLGRRALKGIADPVQAWRVLGEGEAETRFEAYRGRRLTPLVGREAELDLLTTRWESARCGDGQVVLITGEPGIGKSRLCQALQAQIVDKAYTRLRYQCSPYQVHSVLYPIVNQLERAASIELQSTSEEKLNRLEDLLRESSDELERDVPVFAALLSIPLSGRYPPLRLDPQEKKDRTMEALVRQLEGLCNRRPVLAIFEDLHWVDPSTVELLDKLVERLKELPALFLMTFRPEFAERWIDQGHVSVLRLNRIKKAESRTMLDAVLGEETLSERVVSAIVSRADGIPLFIEETGRSVLQACKDVSPGKCEGDRIKVPSTLQDSLMARLDRLSFGKKVAQRGAAIGREFTEDLLKSVCEMDSSTVDRALDELVESRLLFKRAGRQGTVYMFEHALLQDAAYRSLLRARRKPLHHRIASVLTEQSPEHVSLLAHHWELAEEFERAFECRLRAARRASDLYALPEAITQFIAALDLLDQLPQTKRTLQRHRDTVSALIDSTGLTGSASYQDDAQREHTSRHLEKAIRTAANSHNFAVLARLEAYKGIHWMDETFLARAVKHADRSGDLRVQAEVGSRYAGFLGRVGRFEDCYAHTDRTIVLYGELGEMAMQGMTLAGEGRCFSARGGRLDDSLRYAARVRELANETGDPHLNAWKVMESETLVYKGLWDEALRVSREELPDAYESGDWLVVLFASAWAAIACIKLGRIGEAQRFLDEALAAAEDRVGLDYPRAYIQMVTALLQMESGDFDEARVTARAAVNLAESGGYLVEQGAANRALGQICAACGDQSEAEAAFRRSIDQLSNIQSRPELAQTLLAYGRFKRGDNACEGDRLLKRALQMFRDMDATGWTYETRIALGS